MNRAKFVTGYSDLSLQNGGPLSRITPGKGPRMIANFKLSTDISILFPYINSIVQKSTYFDKPLHIRFVLGDFACALFSEQGIAGCFDDYLQAHDFLEKLIAFLNDIEWRKNSIQPNFKTHTRASVLNILELLPKNNCGECGYPTCLVFAAALSMQEALPGQCPSLAPPLRRRASNIKISQLLQIVPHTVKSHVIHIFNKLGVDDRAEAAAWAAHNRLI